MDELFLSGYAVPFHAACAYYCGKKAYKEFKDYWELTRAEDEKGDLFFGFFWTGGVGASAFLMGCSLVKGLEGLL